MMTSGLNYGVRASLPHLFGICFGVPMMLLAAGFGLGYLFERYTVLHECIQIAGIAYLCYLAWLIARAQPATLPSNTTSKPLSFFEAAMFQWINPKAWVMGTSAIAAYTTVGSDVSAQIVAIALLFSAFTFPGAGTWLVFGAGLNRALSNPLHRRVFNVSMALLLVASISPIVWDLVKKYAA